MQSNQAANLSQFTPTVTAPSILPEETLEVPEPGAVEITFAPTRTPFQPSDDNQLVTDATPIPDNLTPTQTAALVTEPPTSTPDNTDQVEPASQPAARLANPIPAKHGFPTPMPYLSGEAAGKSINILLIGSDLRGKGSSFRTDTLVIASIRPDENSVSLLSIPRDLYVYIPGKGMHKINTAYLWGGMMRYPGGGPALLKDTILYNLGIRIDKLAIVNFNGFKQVVDTLGGVDVPVSCAYTDWHIINPNGNVQNPSNWKLQTVGPGVIHMPGDLALWYARSRLKSSDYDRGRRQQEVLRSLYSRAMQLNVVLQIPELYEQLSKNIKTDVELSDVLALVPMAPNLDKARIRSYYITAGMVKSGFAEGMYVQWPKGEKIEKMIQRFLAPPGSGEEKRLVKIVEICNASGRDGWDALAADRLQYAGFKTVACSRTDFSSMKKTMIEDLHPDQDPTFLNELLTIIGISADRVNNLDEPENKSFIRLYLGSDYDPCFSPLKLTH